MPIEGEILFRDRVSILQQMMDEFQAKVADVYLGEDGNLRLILEVTAGVEESVFLANQILSEDMFIATANPVALGKWGDEFGISKKPGTFAEGEVVFTGDGGEYVGLDSTVAYDPGGGLDLLYFTMTEDGTIPNPGIPTAPVLVEGAAGALDGLYEYGVTFVTDGGESEIGETSDPLDVASKKIELSEIPLGGPGTTGRKIYRQVDGGAFLLVATISDNTTTTLEDNNTSPGSGPPTDSTAERITLGARAETTGAQYNAAPHTITVLANTGSGISEVDNPAAFTGGADPENDESYRRRLQALVRNPQSGSPSDLQEWAEEDPDVESATVYPNMNGTTPTNGHVTVRISGFGGSIPDSSIVDRVQARLEEEDIANITIHVMTFTAQTQAVSVQITIVDSSGTTGPEYTLEDLEDSIVQAITDYINKLPIGGTLRKNGIIDAVFGLVGVADLTVTTPGADVPATSAIHKIVPGTITVTEAP